MSSGALDLWSIVLVIFLTQLGPGPSRNTFFYVELGLRFMEYSSSIFYVEWDPVPVDIELFYPDWDYDPTQHTLY